MPSELRGRAGSGGIVCSLPQASYLKRHSESSPSKYRPGGKHARTATYIENQQLQMEDEQAGDVAGDYELEQHEPGQPMQPVPAPDVQSRAGAGSPPPQPPPPPQTQRPVSAGQQYVIPVPGGLQWPAPAALHIPAVLVPAVMVPAAVVSPVIPPPPPPSRAQQQPPPPPPPAMAAAPAATAVVSAVPPPPPPPPPRVQPPPPPPPPPPSRGLQSWPSGSSSSSKLAGASSGEHPLPSPPHMQMMPPVHAAAVPAYSPTGSGVGNLLDVAVAGPSGALERDQGARPIVDLLRQVQQHKQELLHADAPREMEALLDTALTDTDAALHITLNAMSLATSMSDYGSLEAADKALEFAENALAMTVQRLARAQHLMLHSVEQQQQQGVPLPPPAAAMARDLATAVAATSDRDEDSEDAEAVPAVAAAAVQQGAALEAHAGHPLQQQQQQWAEHFEEGGVGDEVQAAPYHPGIARGPLNVAQRAADNDGDGDDDDAWSSSSSVTPPPAHM